MRSYLTFRSPCFFGKKEKIIPIIASTHGDEHASLLTDEDHMSSLAFVGTQCVVCVLVAQLCPTLCNPIDCSPPGPSVHGILQARTQERAAISFSKRNYRKKEREATQLCLTLCNPMDCSLPGSPIHGIFQARVLEWVAISLSRRLLL